MIPISIKTPQYNNKDEADCQYHHPDDKGWPIRAEEFFYHGFFFLFVRMSLLICFILSIEYMSL